MQALKTESLFSLVDIYYREDQGSTNTELPIVTESNPHTGYQAKQESMNSKCATWIYTICMIHIQPCSHLGLSGAKATIKKILVKALSLKFKVWRDYGLILIGAL